MHTSLQEAVLLLRKWADGGALIRCNFSFKAFSAAFRGRLTFVSEREIRLSSKDRTSELVVALNRIEGFRYGEPRTAADGADEVVSGLVLFVKSAVSGAEDEFLVLNEFLEE